MMEENSKIENNVKNENNVENENNENNGLKKMPKPVLEVFWFTEGDIISVP